MDQPNGIAARQSSSSGRVYTGAEFLVHALASVGVTHVFGGHGGAVVPLIDAIEASPDIEWIYCRCEVNASLAAAAHAKLTGKMGCCIGTSGPGASHLLSGLIDADQDRCPVLCITGLKDSSHIRYADFQDIDQASVFRMAGLALSETVADINQLLPLTRNACTVALLTNRCAHLAVPINVQQDQILGRNEFCLGTAFQSRLAVPATQLQVDTLAIALRDEIESKRHVVIACGYRAVPYGKEIERLAELLHCPILTSFDGKGTVDENHPLSFGCVGVYGNAGTPSSVDILADCDTVVSVCINDMTELITNKGGLQVRRLVQIDERLVAGDAMRFSPSAAFSSGFLRESLQQVIEALEKAFLHCSAVHRRRLAARSPPAFATSDAHKPDVSSDVWNEIKKDSYVKPAGTPSTFLKGPCHKPDDLVSEQFCHPGVFFDVMSDKLDSDSIIAADIGDNALWLASSLPAKADQRYLTSEHLGIMGYSVCAGLAAAVSTKNGNRKTLIVAGDGGVQMSLNELATMRDHGAENVLVVVIMNGRLGRVQNENWGPRVHAGGCSIGSPDFVKLFEAYGFPSGMQLSTCDRTIISDTIDKGWKSAGENGVCVIELIQDPNVAPVMHKLPDKPVGDSCAFWEDRIRDKYSHSIYPKIEVQTDSRDDIMSWLAALTEVKTSNSLWLTKGNMMSTSPSNAVETLLSYIGITSADGHTVDTFFSSKEAAQTFDSQFQASMLNAFPAKEYASGTSNSYPLKMQIMAAPPSQNWGLHAHPNVELMVPLVGEVWEKRLIRTEVNPEVLRQSKSKGGKFPLKMDEDTGPDDDQLSLAKVELQEKIDSVKNLGGEGEFVDRPVREGRVLFNSAGSVHRSYTKEEGCLMVVVWSGLHADISNCSCVSAMKGFDGLFSP